MVLPVMTGCSVPCLSNVTVACAPVGLCGIVRRQGINVTAVYVMIAWISVLPSPSPMVPAVMTGSTVRKAMSAVVDSVAVLPGIVRQQGMRVTMAPVMKP